MPETNLLGRIEFLVDHKTAIFIRDAFQEREIRRFAVDTFYRAVVLKSVVAHPLVKKSADIAIRLAVDIKQFLDAEDACENQRFNIEAGMQQIVRLLQIPVVYSSFSSNEQIRRFVAVE